MVQQYILDWPTPINQASVVRLIIAAPIRQGQCNCRAERRKAADAQHQRSDQQNNRKKSFSH
jgi:hypothetical protein